MGADELNDRGDYISGAVGEDGKDVVVGKGITQTEQNVTVNIPPPPPGHYEPDHPIREYTFADLIVAMIGDEGDPLRGRPARVGMISHLATMEARLTSLDTYNSVAHKERLELLRDVQTLKGNQISNVFRVLIFLMVILVIVAAALFIVKGLYGY